MNGIQLFSGKTPQIAHIRADDCIGCTKCIQACPFDAILGSARYLHTVLTEACTGCGLCVAPCPVDCIEMQPVARLCCDPEQVSQRVKARKQRLYKAQQQSLSKAKIDLPTLTDSLAQQDYIQAAIARSKIKKQKLKAKEL